MVTSDKQKFLNSLGIIVKSHKLFFGDLLHKKITSKKVTLVVITNDYSEKTKNKLISKCKDKNIETILLDNVNSNEIGKAIGRINIKAFGINGDNFRYLIKKNIQY